VTGSRPLSALATAIALLAVAPAARGDGGVVRLSERAGPFVVTVFTSPTPLRAGPADVSVMVQDAEGRRPILDAEVSVSLSPLAAGPKAVSARATRQTASNKLLYAALLDLPAPGRWDLRVTVDRNGTSGEVACEVTLTPARPRLLAFWPYLAFPPLAIVLFALHSWLRRRKGVDVERGGPHQRPPSADPHPSTASGMVGGAGEAPGSGTREPPRSRASSRRLPVRTWHAPSRRTRR